MGREAKLYENRNKKTETEVQNTEVIVIGNGPSGISLSYILSGHWPYYNGESHPDEMLQCRLEQLCGQSILEEDLELLSDGLEGRTHRPVALLMDALLHPGADGGLDLPSLLNWQHSTEHIVPHVVLGKTDVGGAWQAMEDDFFTLSLSNWMELADFPFRTWQAEHRKGDDVEPMHGSRIRVREARQYYLDFVAAKGLSQYMRPHTTVTSVERVAQTSKFIDQESGESTGPTSSSNALWEVRGYETSEEGKRVKFCYRAPNVVVATGTFDAPNRLGVQGEDRDYVLHSLSELEKAIQCGRVTPNSDPIVVIGAGLSAADAILLARKHGIPVVHAFHRSAKDPQIILSKLPDQLYPEYREVHQMMKGLVEVDGYSSCERSSVLAFGPSRNVILRDSAQTERKVIQASFAVVLIGTRPQLSYLPDSGKGLGIVPNMPIHPRHNPINADPYTYQSMIEPGLFAMGPLVGENFVRHLQGGGLGIASHLWKVKLGKL